MKSTTLFLTLLFLLHLPTRAHPFQPAEVHDLESVVLIEGLSSGDGRCSGVVISNQGHILTARHCLQKCMFQQGLFQNISEQSATEYQVTNKDKLGQLACEVSIDGQMNSVILEATSPGLITRFNSASLQALNPSLFKKLVSEGFTSRGDFLVLRPAHPLKGKKCRALASSDAAVGADVVTIGYPGATARTSGFNSDGVHATKSEGQISSGIEENLCLSELSNRDSILMQIGIRFNEDTAVMSTVDAVAGASGSPLFDGQSGDVLGVLIQVYDHSWYTKNEGDSPIHRYCEGSTKTLRIKQILNLIAQVRADLLNQLRCQ